MDKNLKDILSKLEDNKALDTDDLSKMEDGLYYKIELNDSLGYKSHMLYVYLDNDEYV